jgi:drug/metabolite transporter (DMT)-like permease
VVPYNYLTLLWAAGLGFLIWGDVPTVELLIGAVIVVGSGLYILWRETLHRRKIVLAAPKPNA